MEPTMTLERLLDSVILIDHFNSIPQATEFMIDLDPEKTAVSVITRAEILAGFDERSSAQAKLLLDQFRLLTIGKEIADETALLRRQHRWKLPDAFQAALAIHHHIKLATRNTKDFHPEDHPFIEIPYQL
jgi:predicted nucleic acid-binding protein